MTSFRITPWVAAIGLAVSMIGVSPVSAATWYKLHEIPLPPGAVNLWANDISDRGEVVGMVELQNGTAAFAFLSGSLSLLAAPVDHVVWGATAVNGTGQIVGGVVSEFGIPKSALWASASDPAPLVLESGGGPDANVYTTGINDLGVISGYYTGSGSGQASSWRAVKWTPDGDRLRQRVLSTGVTPLPDGVFHAAYGINDAGQLVGTGAWITDPHLPSFQAAIRWEANEDPIELATPAGIDFFPRMYAYAINENAISVGELVGNIGVSRAMRWTAAAAVVDLGLAPGFTSSKAVDINDAGVIVGTLSAGTASAAAVHENGAWVDLNSRLIGAPGWLLKSAAAINARGQIIGQAQFGGQSRGVILTPFPDGPGAVPDGTAGSTPLTIARHPGDPTRLDLAWGAACGAAATDYAIYEGEVGAWSSHVPDTCSTLGVTQASVVPQTGNRYFLVVPIGNGVEGSYGTDSTGSERPHSALACFAASNPQQCP